MPGKEEPKKNKNKKNNEEKPKIISIGMNGVSGMNLNIFRLTF